MRLKTRKCKTGQHASVYFENGPHASVQFQNAPNAKSAHENEKNVQSTSDIRDSDIRDFRLEGTTQKVFRLSD